MAARKRGEKTGKKRSKTAGKKTPAKKLAPLETSAKRVPISEIDTEDREYRLRLTIRTRDLEESLQNVGLLHPVLLWEKKSGDYNYKIIGGSRRIEALRKLGEEHVEARVIKKLDDETALRMSLDENRVRKNLKPIEVAIACDKLTRKGTSYEDISTHLRIGKESIKKYRGLLKANDKILTALNDGEIDFSHADILRRQPPEMQNKLLKKCIDDKLTRQQLKKEIKALKKEQPQEKKAALELPQLPEYATIKTRGGNGKLTLAFTDEKELRNRLEALVETLARPKPKPET